MRHLLALAAALSLVAGSAQAAATVTAQGGFKSETYVSEPLPPGFSVQASELDGPVFADERGRTLYMWPYRGMRVGATGDADNVSACLDEKTTKTAGMMSPYPPGMDLPEVESRLPCTGVWPPVLAADNARPVGNFTIIARPDGRKQWAYSKHALYTSILDQQPGDVFGAHTRDMQGDGPAERVPVGPAPNVPPVFAVTTVAKGRLVTTQNSFSIYTSDRDGPEKSNCTGDCTRVWIPVLAGAAAQAQGEWTVFERAPGVRQWAFRKKPVYTYGKDVETLSLQGSDEPGWHNVWTQRSPEPPKGFSIVNNEVGEALVSPQGKAVYVYYCGDDSRDQLACDHPGAPQVYRFAVCGGGNVERCLKRWPYIPAAADAVSGNRSWSVMWVNPKTGRHAAKGAEGAISVWAFRQRPLFTFEGDLTPTDMNGNQTGEFQGRRNGFRAFIVRDDFFGAAN